MGVYVCKMCGATLHVSNEKNDCICEYCGTHQSILSNLSDEKSQNIKSLLIRGNDLLEDHEWKKASRVFDSILDFDPRCAEAYWGKFLASNQLTTAEILDGQFLHNDEFLNFDWGHVTTLNIENPEHLNEIVRKYSVPGFLEEKDIRELYEFEKFYITLTIDYKKQRDQFRTRINKNKSYHRALEFADATLKNEIEKCITALFVFVDERIKESQQEDDGKAEEIKQKFFEFEAEKDAVVQKLNLEAIQKREKEYKNCIAAERRAATINDYIKVTKMFESLGNYKDSYQRYLDNQAYVKKRQKSIERETRIENFIKRNWKKALLAIIVVWFILKRLIIHV